MLNFTPSPRRCATRPTVHAKALGHANALKCALQILDAGTVGALMQMQSIAYCGAFRQPAADLLRKLTAAHPAARRQALETFVRQPPDTSPAEWAAWWAAVQRDLGLGPEAAVQPKPWLGLDSGL